MNAKIAVCGRGYGAAALIGILTTSSFAIQPSAWVHTTEADFSAGQSEHTVATNLGDVKLAGNTEAIGEIPEETGIIFDIELTDDGSTYLAAGLGGKLLRQTGESGIATVLDLDEEQIFCLGRDNDGRLLLGISGETKSRLAVLDETDQAVTLVEIEGVRYIWDMLVKGAQIYLATGTDGKLLRVELEAAEPTITEIVDTAQANLLCLAHDRQGKIYFGTDTDGLIYRVSFSPEGEAGTFVLYDAAEPEIGALWVEPDGTVFAGTADAEQARPGRLEEAAGEETGRLEKLEKGESIEEAPIEPEDLPEVPPQPGPIEPPDNPDEQPETITPSGEEAEVLKIPSDTFPEPVDKVFIRSTSGGENLAAEKPVERPLPTPSDARYDQLREEIRTRLQKARQSGKLQISPAKPGGSAKPSASRPTLAPSRPTGSGQEGNAIYQISPDGFVTEVFRESVMILRLAMNERGRLIVATGNEGQIFMVDPSSDETLTLADLEPQQVSALSMEQHGQIILATSNPASLLRLRPEFAPKGTYTSVVLDAGQTSLWGRFKLTATIEPGTSVAVETRSGNVGDPEQASWSEWSEPTVFEADQTIPPLAPRELTVDCPPARFLQYRLTLNGADELSPVVSRTEIAYVTPNFKPVINSIQATYRNGAQGSTPTTTGNEDVAREQLLGIDWEASDPNGDRLSYTLEYQPAGADKWLLLTDEPEGNSFEWDTKRVPDGRYLIRVTVSDELDNPGGMAKRATRRSDPVVIDNTPPEIQSMEWERTGRTLNLRVEATDALSGIKAVQYTVDANDDWIAMLPEDLLFDSTRELLEIKITDLLPGPHVVTVRVIDGQGNAIYRAAAVNK